MTDSSRVTGRAETLSAPIRFFLPLNVAFYICLVSHTLAAVYAPIQDCDETFNYWEPLHYLNHGYGLQTWEYSPEFSIRSWAYILMHAIPAKVIGFFSSSKTTEFCGVRVILAIICAATETRLYSAISRTLNPRIGVFYLTVVAFTPGFFYASTAFLPSSLAMYTSSLGLTAFMDWRGGPKTATGIMWFGSGALIAWPFSGFLILPFVLEDWVIALYTNSAYVTFRRYLDGIVRCFIVLALQVGVDAFFYHTPVLVPWRIVAYNIFGGKGRGPNIFGTEPWHYYVRNLLLNFNIWFLLAMGAAPLLLLQALFASRHTTQQTILRTITFIMPFYLWLATFTIQPHKEERFMYPVYPFLALNAAITSHMILSWIGTSDRRRTMGKIPAGVKFAAVLTTVLLAINVGLLRVVNTVTSYRAPLQIYRALEKPGMSKLGDTVCFGKDWYRFPSSYFLPNDTHAKFVRSEFDGLLPGEFHEGKVGFGLYPGTWLVPSGMNDRNEEDPGKYTDIRHCTYFVDSDLPSWTPSAREPLYSQDDNWQIVVCAAILDASSTSLLARIIWIPELPIIPRRYRRTWGRHCLLKQRKA